MCEQTPLEYKEGDIVWVKLRTCWWPSEVKSWESVPPELAALKDRSIAVVKFFEEDSYEIIKNLNQIYMYNCKKKNDFIKKGLELYRKENSYMKKFPGDVSVAEEKTGGQPDIINSPMFTPEKKVNYGALIFGNTPKKTPKLGKKRGRHSLASTLSTPSCSTINLPSTSYSPRKSLPNPNDTYFVGTSFKVRIMPQKTESNSTVSQSGGIYTCPTCGFQTPRISVIVVHNKGHIQGDYSSITSPSKKGKKPTTPKRAIQMKHSKTTSIDEDLQLLQRGIIPADSSDEESLEEEEEEPKVKKRKRKVNSKSPRSPKKKPTQVEKKSNPPHDILAEWDATDSEEVEEEDKKLEKDAESVKERNAEPVKERNAEPVKERNAEPAKKKEEKNEPIEKEVEEEKVEENKEETSCFDFNEEEDEKMSKTKTKDEEMPKMNDEEMSKTKDEEMPKTKDEEMPKTKDEEDEKSKSEEKNGEILSEEETTKVEEIIPDVIPKKDKTYSGRKLSKSPEKARESPKVAEKPDELKKESQNISVSENRRSSRRLLKETKKQTESNDEIEESTLKKSSKKSKDKPEIQQTPPVEDFEALMETTAMPELPEIPGSVKEQQNFPLAKIKKIPDKAPPLLDPIVSKSEVATKHTNPKKRFVKAFEDSKNDQTEGEKSPKKENSVEVLKLKSQVMTKLNENVEDIVPKYKKYGMEKKSKTDAEKHEIQSTSKSDNVHIRAAPRKSTLITPIKNEPVIEKIEKEPTPVSHIENQECQVRKKIEIIPKNHGEVNITVTKVLDNNNAKGKYLYSRRQGRYSLKYRSRNSLVESTAEAKQSSDNKVQDVVNPVVTPTVEEMEFPKKSIQREVKNKKESEMPEESLLNENIEGKQENDKEKETIDKDEKILKDDDDNKKSQKNLQEAVEETEKEENEEKSDEIKLESMVVESNEVKKGKYNRRRKRTRWSRRSKSKEKSVETDKEIDDIKEDLANKEKKEETPEDFVDIITVTPSAKKTFNVKSTKVIIPSKSEEDEEKNESLTSKDKENEDKDTKFDKKLEKTDTVNLENLSKVDYKEITNKESIPLDIFEEHCKNNTISISEIEENEEKVTKSEVDNSFNSLTDNLNNSCDDFVLSLDDSNKNDSCTSISEKPEEICEVPEKILEDNFETKISETSNDIPDNILESALDKQTSDKAEESNIVNSSNDANIVDTNVVKPLEAEESADNEKREKSDEKIKDTQTQNSDQACKLQIENVNENEKSSVVLDTVSSLNDKDELSALSTLAAVSELSTPLEDQLSMEKIKVVTENDLENVQVEIVSESESKPVTLINFSVDFNESTNFEKPKGKVESRFTEIPPEEMPSKSKSSKDPEKQTVASTKDSRVKSKEEGSDQAMTSSKLLEILTDNKNNVASDSSVTAAPPKDLQEKPPKLVTKTQIPKPQLGKAKIQNEKIVKPPIPTVKDTVSVQKVTTTKRAYDDIEDIDAFIIQKPTKKVAVDSAEASVSSPTSPSFQKKAPVTSRARGKARIIQQTIITPAGDVIQPVTPAQQEEAIFDINSMPIVLGDQILTPETIENMPVMIQTEPIKKPAPKILNKMSNAQQSNMMRSYLSKPKQVQVAPQKVLNKTNTMPGNKEKFIIVPSTANVNTTTVGKKIMKQPSTSSVVLPVSDESIEPVGNKIMIVTNQQGIQQRVLLTPAQQKMIGYQSTPNKVTNKTPTIKAGVAKNFKSNVIPQVAAKSQQQPQQQQIQQQKKMFVPYGQNKQQVKTNTVKKVQVPVQKPVAKGRVTETMAKTVVIRNQQGQIVKKLYGTDETLLEQQVKEQVQAIKTGTVTAQNKFQTPSKITKRPFKKHGLETTTTLIHHENPPPLSPLKSNKISHGGEIIKSHVEEKPKEQQRPLNQLIIQDALGNQTTITEGQILALPSETVDGQPQSYMLVTLDESGNLTPLNNEALLSLDPNLGISGGGDLSNMVLQVDNNAAAPKAEEKPQKAEVIAAPEPPPPVVEEQTTRPTAEPVKETTQSITCSVNAGSNQQLIISGDPISTQKFIESLTEGNADLANILASAEGNILIHTDGQQILINTESDNQLLLPAVDSESREGDGNPIFASQTNKSQDILAAALADTDVFQNEQPKSDLSPNSTSLFPMNVGNVLETSLTLSSPIMTPLEVPSTNSKKIPDEESDILTTQVPKNVDLPITITDPNISQTVAQQQVVAMMQNNLDLPLNITEGISVATADLNSPSYVYTLPNLDEKTFTNPISMPLLTEEVDVPIQEKEEEEEEEGGGGGGTNEENDKIGEGEHEKIELVGDRNERGKSPIISTFRTPIDDVGLCSLGSTMCSSLSEPPPDMFDYLPNNEELKKQQQQMDEGNANSNVTQVHFGSSFFSEPKKNKYLNGSSVLRSRSPDGGNVDENSREIAVQSPIIAHFLQENKETREDKSEDVGGSGINKEESVGGDVDEGNSILEKRKAEDEFDFSSPQKKSRIE